MSVFRTLAYLSPLLVGFGVPAALALTAGRPPLRRALAAVAVVGGDLFVLFGSSLGDSPRLWGPVAVVLASFSVLVAGLYLALESVRLPREVCQILAGLVVCFLMSTLFTAGPLIRESADAGASGETVSRRITWALNVNPYFVMGYAIFQTDPLYLPVFYRTDLAGFQHEEPSWPASSGGFALVGAVLGGLSAALRRRMLR